MTKLVTYNNGTVSLPGLLWDRILEALDDNSVAWEGEEHSVREEHAELIEELESLGHYLTAHGCGKTDTLPETPPIRVLVALEGGNVQGAVADRAGVSVIVLDYDTEGADADRVFAIPQDGGGTAEAYVGGHSAVHDAAFIDAAEAADLSDPEAALEQLRGEEKQWAADAPALAEEAREAADRLEARLPELLERKEARESAEHERMEQFRADFAARVAEREAAKATA